MNGQPDPRAGAMSVNSRRRTWNLTLPLSTKVVFVDWDGVLSRMRFWDGYSAPDSSQNDRAIRDAVADLFGNDEVVVDWMTGKLGTSEIVQQHLVPKPSATLVSDMHRHVVEQYASGRVDDRWLLGALRRIRSTHQLVLATDNMDCFTDGVQGRRDLARLFDDYISSSDVGVLKADAPDEFFGRWMEQRNVEPADSTLIDDSKGNCAAFETLGGRAILFGSMDSRVELIDLAWPA